MSAGFVVLAALKVLTALGSPGEFAEVVSAENEAVFARAERFLSAQNVRRAKWERHLAMMGLRESRPSLAPVRYRLAVGRRVFSFTVYGRLFVDFRFVRGDEMADILELEGIFRGLHARSPWRGERLRDAREEPLALCGFEDERFARLDEAVERLVGEFNRARQPGVQELPPRLFKSFVVEETYWSAEEVSEESLRSMLGRLASAGGCADGGAFRGWHATVARLHGADFAGRVVARGFNKEVFVPARAWKEKSR